MKILVLNSGSSTLKFQLIDWAPGTPGGQRKLARGIVDRIGSGSSCRFEAPPGAPMEHSSVAVEDHRRAVEEVIAWLERRSEPVPEAVGHRVVHGGTRFTASTLIDDDVVAQLEALSDLAPLHNPPSVSGVRAARDVLGPNVPMVAVFDTSFHRTIPEHAATYAIPLELSKRHGIQRYGFHGLAHEYSAWRYGQLAGLSADAIDCVTLHLGNGCSACAIRGGRSIDTSMGFTPLEGLVMGTRSGDLDPAIVGYLARKERAAIEEVESWLNRRSGLLGISGLSNDMREISSAHRDDPRCRLALEVFCYRAQKYLGAYLAVLGQPGAVIFSGGIGEHSPLVRQKICRPMEWLGLALDDDANSRIEQDGCISPAESRLKAYVVHTDEEMIIARETARVLAAN